MKETTEFKPNTPLNHMKVYKIRDTEVSMFSSQTSYGWHTVAEIKGHYYYLGDQLDNIITAIVLYEKLNNVVFTIGEVEDAMIKNSLRSFPIN